MTTAAAMPSPTAAPHQRNAATTGIAARARQDLLREVRAQSNLLLRRTERCSWFQRPSVGELARVELQASLRPGTQSTARHCVVLLACTVDDGIVVPPAVVEGCRQAVEQCGDAAVRTLFQLCLHRLGGMRWRSARSG